MIRNACAIITSVIIECLQHRAFIATALLFSFFFNDTPTTEIYTTYDTLSLHDALPIFSPAQRAGLRSIQAILRAPVAIDSGHPDRKSTRLNSVTVGYLVCRLLLEKKKHRREAARSAQPVDAPNEGVGAPLLSAGRSVTMAAIHDCCILKCKGVPLDLHNLRLSIPTRRSSD